MWWQEVRRESIGNHQHSAIDLDLGMTDTALRHGDAQTLNGAKGTCQEVKIAGRAFDKKIRGNGRVAIGN